MSELTSLELLKEGAIVLVTTEGFKAELKSEPSVTPFSSNISVSGDRRTKHIKRAAQLMALVICSSSRTVFENESSLSVATGFKTLKISSFLLEEPLSLKRTTWRNFPCLQALGTLKRLGKKPGL